MRKLSKYLLAVFVICSSCCTNESGSPKGILGKMNFFSGKETSVYEVQDTKISLDSKPVNELIQREHFDTDSTYNVYKNALSKNCYFILQQKPHDGNLRALPVVNESLLKEKSYMVVCKDTLPVLEITSLQDFGLGRSRRLMFAFSKVTDIENCDSQVIIGGLFNRYDQYQFKVDVR